MIFSIISQPHDFILWGDPKTGLPVRVVLTSGIEGSTKVTLSDFVFNVDMDASLFSLEPPAGYTGKGVSFGAADTPIFWYRPKDSEKYRVIYADLSVRDSDTPPNVTKGQPVPAPLGPKE